MSDTTKSTDIAAVAENDPQGPLASFFKGVMGNSTPSEDEFTGLREIINVKSDMPPIKLSLPVEITKTEKGLQLPIQYLPNYKGTKLQTGYAFDLYASPNEAVALNSAERRIAVIPCGISVALPVGFEAHIRPSSGWASKGIMVHAGTMGPDFRGEISCIVFNISTRAFRIEPGMRLAQMVVVPVMSVLPVEDDNLITSV